MDSPIKATGEVAGTRYKALPDHLYSDLMDEAVILSMSSGKYYGLNAVGVSIWKALQTPATVDEIVRAVQNEFEVDYERCHREVAAFLERISEEKLVEVIDEAAS